MSKKNTAAAEVRAILIGLALYAGAQLGLALLAARAILPESALSGAQAISCGACVCAAGLLAVRKTSLGALCASLIAAGGFAGVLMVCALGGIGLSWERVGALLASAAIGGVLAGLLGARKGRKRKKRSAAAPKKRT